jgi:hypothetical protein
MTTFKDLKIGNTFRFKSESAWWSPGMARGPWIKISARRYRHTTNKPEIIHTVGTIKVEVTQK